jgi:hypothetical protein
MATRVPAVDAGVAQVDDGGHARADLLDPAD